MASARIHVIGASGSGKTTLARAIAERLAIAHFDADDYYHVPTDPPFQVPRDPEERVAMIERDVCAHESWVLSGGFAAWELAPRLDYSLHVFLWLPLAERLERLERRERSIFGERIRPGGDMEAVHAEFLAWTRGYDDGSADGTNTLPSHEAVLAAATCPVLRIEGACALDESLRRVLAAVDAS